MISPSVIASPRLIEGNLAYEVRAYVAWDIANAGIEVRVSGINEHQALTAGLAHPRPPSNPVAGACLMLTPPEVLTLVITVGLLLRVYVVR